MERFTRLDPAPEVKIDKEKYVKTLKLLALRVPKVRHPTKRAALFLERRTAAAAARFLLVPRSRLTRSNVAAPQAKCNVVMKALRSVALDLPRQRCIMPDPHDSDTRLFLLRESVKDRELPTVTPEQRETAGLSELAWTTHELRLEYDYFNADEILRQILPEGCEVPGSFETVGHIAHLNLRDELREFRHVIGRVLLDKNPRLRTVVNKIGTIESEFRVPTWELLAGDTSLETEVRQHGVTFKVDFGEVYWNSRLEAEHKRVIDSIKPGEILCDVMAGIGPFAVPAAKAGRRVYASDLNPQCTRYLRLNARANKVKNLVKCYNLDARAFIRALLRPGPGPKDVDDEPSKPSKIPPKLDDKGKPVPRPPVRWAAAGADEDDGEPPAGATFDHVMMNLPASAIEFLDAFKGAFDRGVWGDRALPTVHCYTFKKAAETFDDVVRRGEGYFGGKIVDPKIREVRDVAPNKIMLCLSFAVTPEVAFAETGREGKRARTGA